MEWAIAAAEHGLHVLCEKPPLSAEQAVSIDEVCCSQGVQWLDATGWLHHPRQHRFAIGSAMAAW